MADDHPTRDRLVEATLEAERLTGHEEPTDADLRRGVAIRLARIVSGFLLVGVGIALLPLPGPGWVVIGVVTAAFAAASLLVGDQVGRWISSLWETIWA